MISDLSEAGTKRSELQWPDPYSVFLKSYQPEQPRKTRHRQAEHSNFAHVVVNDSKLRKYESFHF